MFSKFKSLIPGFRAHLKDEEGAITVDWVVLTAGMVGIAAVSAAAILGATTTLGGDITSELQDSEVNNGVN